MPATITGQRPPSGTPEETTPQPKAHIGGNQVIGLSSSSTAGRRPGADGHARQLALTLDVN